MAADAAETWRKCFGQWPAEIERRGVLVTSFGEQVAFESFSASPDLLLLERRAPDTVGARTVLIAYHHIVAVKVVDVVKSRAFDALGFVPPPSRK